MKIKYSSPKDSPPATLLVLLTSIEESTDEAFVICLSSWKSWENRELVELGHFVNILNRIDARLEVLLESCPTVSDDASVIAATSESAFEDIKSFLTFSTMILTNTIGKDIYNSAERVVQLLSLFDDQVTLLAVETLCALALPPMYHRSTLDWSAHATPLHYSSGLCKPLFAILECMNMQDNNGIWVPLEQFLSAEFQVSTTKDMVSLDIASASTSSVKISKKPTFVDDNEADFETPECFQTSKSMTGLVNIAVDQRSLQTIVTNSPQVPASLKFQFLWSLRMRRMRRTIEGRKQFIKVYYMITAILFCCYHDPFVLSQFYVDKNALLQDFLYLLRTGPGSDMHQAELVDLSTRLLAGRCLHALITEDNVEAAILGRFALIQHSLGLNRGQYMGLLPCLLRSCASHFVAIVESELQSLDAVSCASSICRNSASTDVEDLLLWIESIYLLAMSVLQFTETSQFLVDNGLLSSVLACIRHAPVVNAYPLLLYVDTLILSVADTIVASSPLCIAFLRQKGLEATIDRFHMELKSMNLEEGSFTLIDSSTSNKRTRIENAPTASASEDDRAVDITDFSESGKKRKNSKKKRLSIREAVAIQLRQKQQLAQPEDQTDDIDDVIECNQELCLSPCVPNAKNILVLHLISVINGVVERDQDTIDHQQSQMLRGELMTNAIKTVYRNAHVMSSRIVASVHALIADMINHDNSTPAMLTHFISSGVAELFLSMITEKVSRVVISEDYLVDSSNLVFSLGLTCDGLELIKKYNPFPIMASIFLPTSLMSKFSCQRLATMVSSDTLGTFGANLEEIVRHYPLLMPICMDSFISVLSFIVMNGELQLQMSCNPNIDEFLIQLHMATGAVQCLTHLLSRESTITYFFVEHNGCNLLTRLLKIAMGPTKFLLANFASATDASLHCIGHTDLLGALASCINTWFTTTNENSAPCNVAMAAFLTAELNQLKTDVASYWIELGSADVDHNNIAGMLKSMSSDTLPKQCSAVMDRQLFLYANVLRHIAAMSQVIGLLNSSAESSNQRGFLPWDCTCLVDDKLYPIMETIIKEVFIPCQRELCCNVALQELDTNGIDIWVHKQLRYKLLVVQSGGVQCRETVDDSSGRLGKVPKGSIVYATERVASHNKVMKYHIEGGWINGFRNQTKVEPQLQVLEVEEMESAVECACASKDCTKRFGYEYLSNVSPRHAGYVCFALFTKVIRMGLQQIGKLVSQPAGLQRFSCCKLYDITKEFLVYPIAASCDAVNVVSPVNTIVDPVCDNGKSVIDILIEDEAEKDTKPVKSDDFHSKMMEFTQSFFCHTVIPVDFDLTKTIEAANVVEHFYSLIFQYDSNSDANVLLLIHLQFTSDLLDKILHISVLLMLSCMKAASSSYDGQLKISLGNAMLVLDLWKRLAMFCYNPVLPVELKFSTELLSAHRYDGVLFRKSLLILLSQHIFQVWNHENLRLLPATLVKEVFEVYENLQRSFLNCMKGAIKEFTFSDVDEAEDDDSLDALSVEETLEEAKIDDEIEAALAEAGVASSSTTNTAAIAPEIILSALPRMPFFTIRDKIKLYVMLPVVHAWMCSESLLVCFRLIEHGIESPNEDLFSNDMLVDEAGYSQDAKLAMIVHHLHTCYYTLESLGEYKILTCLWLFKRAIDVITACCEKQDISGVGELTGLLHAITLLMFGRLNDSSRHQQNTNPAMMYLIVAKEGHYNVLMKQLLVLADRMIGASNSSNELSTMKWVGPAILVLDVMTQSMLIDSKEVRRARTQMGIVKEIHERLRSDDIHGTNALHVDEFLAWVKAEVIRNCAMDDDDDNLMNNDCYLLSNGNSVGYPLLDSLLDGEVQIHSIRIVLQLLQSFQQVANSDSKNAQTMLNFLAHVTKYEPARIAFQQSNGVNIVLRAYCAYPGMYNVVFTILQRQLEDPKLLRQLMETDMKYCFQRLRSKTKNSTSVPLRTFVDALCALLYRDQRIFLDILQSTFAIKGSRHNLTVELLQSDCGTVTTSSADIARDCNTGDTIGTVQIAVSNIATQPVNSVSVQSVVDGVLHLLHDNWLELQDISREMLNCAIDTSSSVNIHLPHRTMTLADTLLVLADLVAVIPGVAACVHKFKFNKDTTISHGITGNQVSSSSFLTFLIHGLLLHSSDVRADQTPLSVPSSQMQHSREQMESKAAGIRGEKLKEAAGYLLAALVSRPGEGRRRALAEVVNAFKLTDSLGKVTCVETAQQFKSLGILSEALIHLIHAPSHWKAKGMFIAPCREILTVLTELKVYVHVSDVLCAVQMEHPLALSTTLKLSAILDAFIRKGLAPIQPAKPKVLPAASSTSTVTAAPIAGVGEIGSPMVEENNLRHLIPPTTAGSTERSQLDENGEDHLLRHISSHTDDVSSNESDDDDDDDDVGADHDDDDNDGNSHVDDHLEDDDESDGHLDEDDEVDDDDDDEDDDGELEVIDDLHGHSRHSHVRMDDEDDEDESIHEDDNDGFDNAMDENTLDEQQDDDNEGDEDHDEDNQEHDDEDEDIEDEVDDDGLVAYDGAEHDHSAHDRQADVDIDEDENADDYAGDEEVDDNFDDDNNNSGRGIVLDDDMFNREFDAFERNYRRRRGAAEDDDEDDEGERRIEEEYNDLFPPAGRGSQGGSHRRSHHRAERGDAISSMRIGGVNGQIEVRVDIGNRPMSSFIRSSTGTDRSQSHQQPALDEVMSNFYTRHNHHHHQMQRPEDGIWDSHPPMNPLLQAPQQLAKAWLPRSSLSLSHHPLRHGIYPRASKTVVRYMQNLANPRFPRFAPSPIRQSLGPLTSDRRWGTDIGEVEYCGERLSLLVSQVEAYLDPIIQRTTAVPFVSAKALCAAQFMRDLIFGNMEETKEEEYLQETKEDDEPVAIAAPQSSCASDDSNINTTNNEINDNNNTDNDNNADSTAADSEAANQTNGGGVTEFVSQDDMEVAIASPEVEEEESDSSEASHSEHGDTEALTTTSTCPPGIEQSVWTALPLEMQLELLQSMDLDTSDLIEAEIAASDVDRQTLMNLPPHLLSEVLVEESTQRKRRASFDITTENMPSSSSSSSSSSECVVPAGNDTMPLQSQASSIVQNAVVAASCSSSSSALVVPALSHENIEFINSLSLDLRQEVLSTAEPDFLQTLTAGMQMEARELARGFAPAPERRLLPWSEQLAIPGGGSADGRQLPTISMETLMQGFAQSLNSGIVRLDGPDGQNRNAEALGAMLNDLLGNAMGSRGQSMVMRMSRDASSSSLRKRANATPSLTIEQTAGRSNGITELPFNRYTLARLIKCVICVNKPKCPRQVARLLATMCSYDSCRSHIIRAVFNTLNGDQVESVRWVKMLPESTLCIFNADLDDLLQSKHMLSNPTVIRRFIGLLSYLSRKTGNAVWLDIMVKPIKGEDALSSPWLFGQLIALLGNSDVLCIGVAEAVLQLIIEFCAPFQKLSVLDANTLVGKLAVANHPTVQEVTDKDDHCEQETKRVRVEVDSSSTPLASNSSTSNESKDDVENLFKTAPTAVAGEINKPGDDVGRSMLPYPVLGSEEAAVMARFSAHNLCGGEIRKQHLRILRTLSLSDGNWTTFLITLSHLGEDLAKESLKELLSTVDILRTITANAKEMSSGDNTAFLQTRLLFSPSSVTEHQEKLLHVLETMTVLRSRSSTTAATESEIVSSHIRQMDFGALWDILCECLDMVRYLEGLIDPVVEESADSVVVHTTSSSSSSNSSSSSSRSRHSTAAGSTARHSNAHSLQPTAGSGSNSRGRSGSNLSGNGAASNTSRRASNGAAAAPPASRASTATAAATAAAIDEEGAQLLSLSSLTMRFMPLIECFMTVCGATVLRKPMAGPAATETGHAGEAVSLPATPCMKGQRRKLMCDTLLPPLGDLESNSDETVLQSLLKPLSVPGTRFRQHQSYMHMQMELEDNNAAQRLITFTERNRLLLNMALRNNVQLLESSFSTLVYVPRCRNLLHFDLKRAYFKMKLKRMKQQASRSTNSFSGSSLHISVRRSEVFMDSFQSLRYKSADEMRRKLSVHFHGEEGMDAGGLTREWFSVLAKEIFNANYALFIATNDNVTFQPNAYSYVNPEHLSYFKFVGRVIGKAMCDGFLFDAHFTRSFYKHILGLPVSYHDLEAIEPDYYKSLKQILVNNLDDLGLDLTFSAETNDFGKVEVVDLVTNGREILVTDENKHEYVRLIAHHRMTTAIKKQIDAVLEGFHELVPPELISIFDAQELELLISGLPDIDLDDLRANTEYQGYKSTDQQIHYFWTVLKSFTKEERALFLQFVTGTSKVPLDGFKSLNGSDGVRLFNIQKAFGGSHMLPCAHTCFNQLDLPEYKSEEELREKLLIAIKEGSEGFGFA